VRAEGLEPSSSFEHGHLKPARLPISPRPHAQRIVPFRPSAHEPAQAAAEYLLRVSTTRRRRSALIALVILAAGGCLALGWWQWTRFQSVSGTFQNLGYAMQWPLFAGFCVYAYRKFVRYEEAPPDSQKDRAITELPDGLLPERPKPVAHKPDDPALREYNAYLAELAKVDNEIHPRQNRTTA
jgi:DNA-binding transcriptional regulator of glucitol operon